jgi:Holliday junction resolvase RusA-like endonuclease
MPRPKKHFRANGELRDDAPTYHTQAPDIDKLSRSILDALKGISWRDDGQVSYKLASKQYTEGRAREGADIRIVALD